MAHNRGMETIVVGSDGSPAATAALEWAIAEARLRDARLLVVHAWAVPVLAYSTPYGVGPTADLIEAERKGAAAALDAALERVDVEGVDVQRRVVEGPAAQSLLEAAEDADLLVVGSRGHGGFAGLLLGSVSQQCAQHAPCPVVIVRAPAA
jgi:nucleotide-binding universal stress UspA family protein